MNTIALYLSETSYFEIKKDESNICYVQYKDLDRSIDLGSYDLFEINYKFTKNDVLKNSIRGTHIPPYDLGLTWNNQRATINRFDGIIDYYFLGINVNSWIYNDLQGNIIFEITPIYIHAIDPSKNYSKSTQYKRWIKQYKPLVKIQVEKKNLDNWAIKIQELQSNTMPA